MEFSYDCEIMFTVGDLKAIKLTVEDATALQELLGRCNDYYEMAEGRPAVSNAGMEEITFTPASCSINDNFCLGLQSNANTMIGVISAMRHHRRLNQWYLGFFMLQPDWRGRGVGRATYTAFERWLSA